MMLYTSEPTRSPNHPVRAFFRTLWTAIVKDLSGSTQAERDRLDALVIGSFIEAGCPRYLLEDVLDLLSLRLHGDRQYTSAVLYTGAGRNLVTFEWTDGQERHFDVRLVPGGITIEEVVSC